MSIVSKINEIKNTITSLSDWVSYLDENFIFYHIFFTSQGANDMIEIRTKDDTVVATLNVIWNDLTYFNDFLDQIENERNRLLMEIGNENQLNELNSIVDIFGCQ